MKTAREAAELWFGEVWGKRNQNMIAELMAPGVVGIMDDRTIKGPEDFIEFQNTFITGVPDAHLEIERIVADETQACVLWKITGTQTGIFFGIPASNKKISITGTSFMEVIDGKISRDWDHWNRGDLIQYLTT